MRKILLAIALMFVVMSGSDAYAAEIVKQKGNVFGQPQVVSDGVKLPIAGNVKFVRHTKYSESTFGHAIAYKQLRATTRFTATKYTCPGYYISRAYSDTSGSALVGYVYVKVANEDISNKNCEKVDTSDRPQQPTEPINATHPVPAKKEKSKMVQQNEEISEAQPKVVANPETIRAADEKEEIEPTQAEIDAFFERSEDYDACLDGSTHADPQLMRKPGETTYHCVDALDCAYDGLDDAWYCQPGAVNFKDEKPPESKVIYYDIPAYNQYQKDECEDNSQAENCNYMYELGPDGTPTGASEKVEVPEPTEPTEPEPTEPTVLIAACKPEGQSSYKVLVNGQLQMNGNFTSADVKYTVADVSVDGVKQIFVSPKDGMTLQVGNSNVLTKSDFDNAQPCPTDEDDEDYSEITNQLKITACLEPGTKNQFSIIAEFDVRGNGDYKELAYKSLEWQEFPSTEAATLLSTNKQTPEGNKQTGQFVINNTEPFAFTAMYELNDNVFVSNTLTSNQILNSGDCSTTGSIEGGEPPVNGGNEENPNDVPPCYCPSLDKLGAGLGYLCCVWECPGLDEIISDGKQFLSDDLVGTATAPEVPEFNPPPMPNIFDILDGVDKSNQPAAPTGQNAPGLEDAGFTADDVNQSSPEIEFQEDTTGGFNIIDPISNLPADGSNAPRPKESTADKPDLTGGSGDYNGTATPPGYDDNTATPPTSNGTATPPGYDDEVKYPGT